MDVPLHKYWGIWPPCPIGIDAPGSRSRNCEQRISDAWHRHCSAACQQQKRVKTHSILACSRDAPLRPPPAWCGLQLLGLTIHSSVTDTWHVQFWTAVVHALTPCLSVRPHFWWKKYYKSSNAIKSRRKYSGITPQLRHQIYVGQENMRFSTINLPYLRNCRQYKQFVTGDEGYLQQGHFTISHFVTDFETQGCISG